MNRRLPLWLELIIIIILKMTLLMVLWWYCFSVPPLGVVNEQTVSTHLLFQHEE